MNKKNTANTAAVIEIDSSCVRMRVSQLSKGALSTLDLLEYPITLGRDMFESGSISFDSLRELSSVLEKFSSALLTYNIQKARVISCAALRDAKNRSLVTDQLRVRNDLDVTVLDDGPEKAYICSEISTQLKDMDFLKRGNSLIAYVSSGSIGVAVYDGTKIIYSQSIADGTLKLREILESIRNDSEDFHKVIEEYLDMLLGRIALSELTIKNLIFTGVQIDFIARLCGSKHTDDFHQFGTKGLSELYLSLRSLTPGAVGRRYGIGEEQAMELYTALSVYQAMLRFCPKTSMIYSPSADISGAVARCVLSPKAEAERAAYCRKSALACAEAAAGRLGCDPSHSQYVRECACRIFDKLKRLHGLDPSKRLILELAAILHSCGSFVSARRHSRCTFDLIRGMDLFGLSEAEILETAFIAGSVSDSLAIEENPDFARLSNKEKLVVSKLAAIFRIANALDKSHRQKLRDVKASVEEGRFLLKAAASEDCLLERWAFHESAQFFKEVFGLSPELSVKFELI